MKKIIPSKEFLSLVEITKALRDPENGCPWDLEQDFASIRHYTIEEAYEVADAIEREDFEDLREELGDLLLQPVFLAQLASEKNLFNIDDVILAVTEKLIRRHPHVFGNNKANNAKEAKESWDKIKQSEAKGKKTNSILSDVPNALPALSRADKLSKKAAKVGFDWPDWQSTYAKCLEELSEIKEEIDNNNKKAIYEEIGDALFALANLARHLDIDPEAALRDANNKFVKRFSYVEARCEEDNIDIKKAGLERLDKYWNEIRNSEKNS